MTAAQNASPEAVADFWGSLYVNLGQIYEDLGNLEQAEAYYALAEAADIKHTR